MIQESPKTLKEYWQEFKHWVEIGGFLLLLAGFIIDHLDILNSAYPTIATAWRYVWPTLSAYAAYRVYRFGKSLNQRFRRLETQVLQSRANMETSLEALEKSYQARLEEVMKYVKEAITKQGRELDKQAYNRFENLAGVVREDIKKERAKLESKFIELENALFPEKRRNAAIARIAKALTDQQVTPSLADMTPARLLATGAPLPKQKNSLADILNMPGTTGKPPTP
jgi:dGTP triphosphohydrolase